MKFTYDSAFIKNSLSHLLWLLPFICFLFGYSFVSYFITSETIQTPLLTGKKLQDVVAILAPYHLPLRILDEVEEPSLAEGTVLKQQPLPGQKIKIYQSVGVVVTKHPRPEMAPQFVGSVKSAIHAVCADKGLRPKTYRIESMYPSDQCVAQFPAQDAPLPDKTIIVYVSGNDDNTRLMPNLIGRRLFDVDGFIRSYGLSLQVFPADLSTHTECAQCTIVAQKPLPESFVDPSKPFAIQVRCIHNS